MANVTCSVDGCEKAHDAKGHPDPTERFWSYVDKNTSSGCWEWTGGLDRDGYGQRFRFGEGRRSRPHRFSFFLEHGRFPAPWCLHRCDNPKCVRPDHLYEGTNVENVRDRQVRGRQRRGGLHPMAKLSEADAREIKRLLAVGDLSGAEIGRRFGVSRVTVSAIKVGRLWGHIDA